MFQLHTRRKGRTTARHFLVIFCVSVLLSNANAAGKWTKCMKTSKQGPPRTLDVGQKANLTLEMSSRITHQLMTHIYRILLEEELGYAQVEIIEKNDYDPVTIMERMDCLQAVRGGFEDVLPKSMINLEVPVPPAFISSALDSCVDDLGAISPAGYFGWFIPMKWNGNTKTVDPYGSHDVHWTRFKDSSFTQYLRITDKPTISFVEDNMVTTQNGAKSYYCKHVNCTNGWYIPEKCNSNQCAMLLAPDYESTKVVIDHISSMKLYVKVAWLGPNLASVVERLTSTFKKVKDKGFVIMSWTPSEVIMNLENFIVVGMMRCDPGATLTEPGCFYDKKLLVKYAWKDLAGDNTDNAYTLLKGMNFLEPEHYHNLTNTYIQNRGNSSIQEIACKWVTDYEVVWTEWIGEVQNTVYIGGIFPISGSSYTGRGIVKGATMAVEAVNRNLSVLTGYKLELKVADGQCRADKVMKAFIDYLTKNLYNSLVGVLGPACSETVEPLAGLSKYYKTITISYSAEGAVFSDRDKYPYFLRTIGENKNYKHVYLELFKSLGWKRVAALTEDGQKYTEYISHMQDTLESKDITFVANIKFPRHREKDPMTRYLEDLKSKRARIIIADVFDEIARNVMCEAYKLGMTAKQGYVWFLPSWLNNTWYDTNSFNANYNESVNCTTANMMEAINGYFAMTHAYFGNDDQIMQENITVAKWREVYQNQSANALSSYAGYAYDAVWTYAYALDKLIKENPDAMFNLHTTNITNKLTNIIKNSDFNGVSGNIKFRGGTTRFSIINVMQWYNNKSTIVGRFYPNISETAPEILGGHLDLNKSAIYWLVSGNGIPDDGTPPPVECTLNALAKFLNVKCEMAIILLNLVISVILIVALSIVIIIIKKRYDKKVQSTEQYMKSLGLNHLLATDYTGLDKWEIERESVVLNRKLGEGAFGTVYGGEANLPDSGWTPVAVKTLKVGSTTEEKLDFLSEAEVMKRFDHKNIVKLLGVCTKVEPVYTIMEFMLYGDLKTYLLARRHLVNGTMVDETEEVSSKKLTSMALDVARGLSYLAELKYVHRDVASRNCLLSQQRVVKLGDFGMTRPTFDNDYYKFNRRGMLPVRWMAPESLGLGVFTPSSDVWSFGVLLYEIITFGSFPFQGLSNSQVLDFVKAGNTITIPQGVKAPLECLLKTCWHSDPKLRPSASELVEYLANNSRLISPCLDLPLSSVQMEDTGQLEMQLPDQFRKCSSSLSFKNLPLVNGISSMSIHTPTRRQQSVPGDSGVSIPMENCCPKEPLLPPRSDSISGCSKYVTIQQIPADALCDQDDIEDYFPNPLINGHAISKV